MIRTQAELKQQHLALLEQLQRLRKDVTGCNGQPSDDLIHKIRVVTKRVRAEAMLIESRQKAKAVRQRARKLAGYLAPVREAQVMMRLLDQLFEATEQEEVLKVQALLEARTLGSTIDKDHLGELLQALETEVFAADQKNVSKGEGAKLLKSSQKKLSKRANNISAANRESYHDWRKAVKEYLFLLKVLERVPGNERHKVKSLGELLGELHDLHDLERCFDLVTVANNLPSKVDQVFMSRENDLLKAIDKSWVDLVKK